jgi:hypothetical protein
MPLTRSTRPVYVFVSIDSTSDRGVKSQNRIAESDLPRIAVGLNESQIDELKRKTTTRSNLKELCYII